MIYRSPSRDPFFNLALEETLLLQAPIPSLLLWTGERAVIIGRNQNPWRECNLPLLRRNGIPLARRISGGGAVYHDPGNQNFSFLLERKDYSRECITATLAEVIEALGCAVHPIGSSGLGTGGRKLTGQAFYMRGNRVLHHATLLLDADLSLLRRCLRPAGLDIKDRCVNSVASPTANIREHLPHVSREQVERTLVRTYRQNLAPEDACREIPSAWRKAAAIRAKDLADWRHVFGRTAPFSLEVAAPGGMLTIDVKEGRVRKILSKTAATPAAVPRAMVGHRLRAPELAASLSAAGAPSPWPHWAAKLPF